MDSCPFCSETIVKTDKTDEVNNKNSFKFTKDFAQKIKSLFQKAKNEYDKATKKLPMSLLKVVFVLLLVFFVGFTAYSITDTITTKKFNQMKNNLAQQEVDTVVMPTMPQNENFELIPNSTSIYESSTLYVFQLFKEHTIDSEDGIPVTCDYYVSVYLQKPTNTMGYMCKDWRGELISEKYFIEVILKENPESKRKIDLLQLNKVDSVTRLDNVVINDIKFETYQAKNETATTYYLISDAVRGVHVIYAITSNTSAEIPNFNYLVNVTFNIDECTKKHNEN